MHNTCTCADRIADWQWFCHFQEAKFDTIQYKTVHFSKEKLTKFGGNKRKIVSSTNNF